MDIVSIYQPLYNQKRFVYFESIVVMKSLAHCITLFLLIISSTCFADTSERYYDSFAGMLEKRGDDLVFIRCGYKEDPMKFVPSEDADQKSINEAVALVQNNPLVFIRTVADVVSIENNENYKYIIYVKFADVINTGESCHFTDIYADIFKEPK